MGNRLLAELKDRSLIALSGPDTLTFLQGIVTNDVENLGERRALFSTILTPQGKFLDDFFLFRIKDRIFIDCADLRRDGLIKRLSMYRLRAAVEIEPVDNLAIAALFTSGKTNEMESEKEPGYACPVGEGVAFIDPRDARLGARIVVPSPTLTEMAEGKNWDASDIDTYREARLALAIAEGPNDIVPEKSYPMDYAFDALNAISFTKGCYVGQEVTARMKARDLVKRRPVSFRLEGSSAEQGMPVLQDGKTIGEVRSRAGEIVLALVSNDIEDSDLHPETESGTVLTPIEGD